MYQQVFIGENAIVNLFALLKNYMHKNIFLVHGKDSYQNCGAKKLIDSFCIKNNINIIEYSEFDINPKYEDLERGIKFIKSLEIQIIIGIGGGSVLDMTKLLRFFNSYSGNPIDNNFHKIKTLIPLISIPTTAGTGSEATHFAVLYKDNIKYSIEHDDILPNYAIIDSSFTYDNSKYLTACSGFDALSQAFEAYWNKNATKESDRYAKKAITLLWTNLPLVVNFPSKHNRNKVSEGSYWAGKAINITKTTAPHAFSYPFTSIYRYPHGHAVALTFPYFAKLNLASGSKEAKKFAELNICHDSNWFNLFYNYISSIGLDFINTKFDIDLILSQVNQNRLNNNPVNINLKNINIECFKY